MAQLKVPASLGPRRAGATARLGYKRDQAAGVERRVALPGFALRKQFCRVFPLKLLLKKWGSTPTAVHTLLIYTITVFQNFNRLFIFFLVNMHIFLSFFFRNIEDPTRKSNWDFFAGSLFKPSE